MQILSLLLSYLSRKHYLKATQQKNKSMTTRLDNKARAPTSAPSAVSLPPIVHAIGKYFLLLYLFIVALSVCPLASKHHTEI